MIESTSSKSKELLARGAFMLNSHDTVTSCLRLSFNPVHSLYTQVQSRKKQCQMTAVISLAQVQNR